MCVCVCGAGGGGGGGGVGIVNGQNPLIFQSVACTYSSIKSGFHKVYKKELKALNEISYIKWYCQCIVWHYYLAFFVTFQNG